METPMARNTLSAEEIQQYIQVRVNYLREVQEDDVQLRVPLPHRCQPGADGCNWAIGPFEGEKAYEPDIRGIVQQAQKKFNLPEG
jgi:hypothetical protein